jgi:hypothetical protein
MKLVRPALLALLATLPLAGCRTAGVGNLARPEPIAPLATTNTRALIAEHNRNAERIQRFEARPSITVRSAQMNAGAGGRLAFERPRNFKLTIAPTAGSDVADIGSNDTEFWFWIKESKQRVIYYCNYEDLASSSLDPTFQPDWIIEALGLRIIPEEEADEITVKRGSEPGTLELIHRPTRAGSRIVTRVTILDEATHRIRAHKLLSGDQKTLLAQATVTGGYQSVPVDSKTGAKGETVTVPRALKLQWVQQKWTMEVSLDGAKASTEGFDLVRREGMFVEPSLGKGVERKNLATLPPDPVDRANASTTIRESLPAPPTRVRLGNPTPLSLDRAPLDVDDDQAPRTALVDQYVGPRLPSPPDPDTQMDPNAGWRNVSPPSFER